MIFRQGQNLAYSGLLISKFIASSVSNQFIHRAEPLNLRRKAIEATTQSSQKLLERLNVRVNHESSEAAMSDQNYFMVSNHMSYFDILILSSIRPSVFVTSVEMEKTFFLGDMAKWGGSFFVDRVNRRKMKDEVKKLEELLGSGFNVFIFPEGTSTNGDKILPFKKSLFRVPYQAGSPILPICLKYNSIDGEAFSPNNCDKVCWYDDMTFAPHFMSLMNTQSIDVTVTDLVPLLPDAFDSHGELAAAAEEQIRSKYFSN